jgi:hypothetical protein
MNYSELNPNEFNAYYANYIRLSGEDNILSGLLKNLKAMVSLLDSLPEEKLYHAYAPGKWTIKELIVHLIDSERVFAYRALRFARMDATDLPGYDQDKYVTTSLANNRTKRSLISEYTSVRNATITLFESFNEEMMLQIGTGNKSPMSTRALGFIIVGHERHHINIINDRYL